MGVTKTWWNELKGHNIKNIENHCLKAKERTTSSGKKIYYISQDTDCYVVQLSDTHGIIPVIVENRIYFARVDIIVTCNVTTERISKKYFCFDM